MVQARFFISLGAFGFAVFILTTWMERYRVVTELAPYHSHFWIVAALEGAVCGFLIALFCLDEGAGQLKVYLIVCCGLIAAIPGLQIGQILQARDDLPPGKTREFSALLLITYADEARNVRVSHPDDGINVRVSPADYRWLVDNARYRSMIPGNIGGSHRFCERVEIEQSGRFLAVMNAGSRELPTGSVGFCDEMRRREPMLPVVSYLNDTPTVQYPSG